MLTNLFRCKSNNVETRSRKKSGKQWSCKKPERALLKLYLFERKILLPDLAKSEKGKKTNTLHSTCFQLLYFVQLEQSCTN